MKPVKAENTGHSVQEDSNGHSLCPDANQSALTLAERDTIAHLLRRGMGHNSVRAIRSDLGYLEAWSAATTGLPLSWPPTKDTVLRFVAHHLWDPDQKARDASHGMPDRVRMALQEAGFLRSAGPHAPSTVERRISTWRSICRWRDVEGPFSHNEVKRTLRAAMRASPRLKGRHSKHAIGTELIVELLDHLDAILRDGRDDVSAFGARYRAMRDRALIATMFASGGRRRSEISDLVGSQIHILEDLAVETGDPIPSIGIRMGRTKTTATRDDTRVFLSGRAAVALSAWIEAAAIGQGPVFLRIDRWGNIGAAPVTPGSVNLIVKTRLKAIGQDPRDFSAHGIRAGYITSALKEGIPAPEVMEQTLHRSLDTLLGYFKDEKQREGRAAKLL